MDLKNYCCNCGKKLKENKKGYSGKNRKFHKTCLDLIGGVPSKSDFNFIGKSDKKIPTNDETRKVEYDNYYFRLNYAMRQNLKSYGL